MTKAAKRYDVHGGVTLRLGYKNSFQYHGPSKYDEPTVRFKIGGHGVLQKKDVMKAASRVMRCTAEVERGELRLSTRSPVQSWAEGLLLTDAFVEELNKLLRERDHAVSRHLRYINRP